MVKIEHRDRFVILQYFADSLAVASGLYAAWWIKFHSGLDPFAVEAANYVQQFWWAFPLWMICLYFTGCIQAHPRVISFNRGRRILRASALAMLLCAVRNYFFREPDVARMLYPMAFFMVSGAVVVMRVVLQLFVSRFMMSRGILSRVLIVGSGPVAIRLGARFKSKPELGYELVGFVTLNGNRVGQSLGGAPILGSKDDLRRVVRDNQVDEVFVTQTDIPGDVFFQLFIDSEKETARVSFVPSLVDMMRSTIHYDEVAGIPIYSMKETPLQGANASIKRAMDVVCSGLGLVALSPLLVLIAVLVRRSSPGPVLYKQTRLGLDGREFKIYKFRTMTVEAERHGPAWGSQEDPRATAIGRWLRTTNLDELPQLWNVLRGDMSLVGPRPERPCFVERFREMFPRYMARHAVKTGMTGWAQVHGLRGDTSIQQRLRYDLYYIENWSLWLDVKILMMTFLPQRHRPRAGRSPFPHLMTERRASAPSPVAIATRTPTLGGGTPSAIRTTSHAPES
ncbi:undecaprenyl-phosphate glucose phosphotransferase [bacterium]|nr:undecaprenyl-phosphate glucose phosphotransferase [bacterium]